MCFSVVVDDSLFLRGNRYRDIEKSQGFRYYWGCELDQLINTIGQGTVVEVELATRVPLVRFI